MSNINNIKKIFLVDDEYDLAMLFKLGLELEGFIVDMFVDPLTALSFFKNDYSSYDLALLDIKMPNLNGYELCNEMVKIHNKIKICFITAFDVQKRRLANNSCRSKFNSCFTQANFNQIYDTKIERTKRFD